MMNSRQTLLNAYPRLYPIHYKSQFSNPAWVVFLLMLATLLHFFPCYASPDSQLTSISPDQTKLFRLDPDKRSLTVLNLITNHEQTITQNIGIDPTFLLIAPDGETAYIANKGDSSLTVLDLKNSLSQVIKQNIGSKPSYLASTSDGKKIYIANTGSQSVSVLDPTTQQVKLIAKNICESPVLIAITPDDSKAYVISIKGNSISSIDTMTDRAQFIRIQQKPLLPASSVNKPVLMTSKFGGEAPLQFAKKQQSHDNTKGNASSCTQSQMLFALDGKKAYILNQNTQTVSVLNTANDTSKVIIENLSPSSFLTLIDGDKIFIGSETTSRVITIDTITDAYTLLQPIESNPFLITNTGSNACIYSTGNMSDVSVDAEVTPLSIDLKHLENGDSAIQVP